MWCIVKKKEITKRLNLNEHVKRRIFKHTIESIWIFIRSPIYDKQTFQQSRLNVPNILVPFHPQLFGHASTYLEQQHGPLQILILKFHSLLFSFLLVFCSWIKRQVYDINSRNLVDSLASTREARPSGRVVSRSTIKAMVVPSQRTSDS